MGIVSRSQSGGGGGSTLFSSTLGADAAAIDTGVNGIAQTATLLLVTILARTDAAGASDSVAVTVNGDGGANYDRIFDRSVNATVTGLPTGAQTAWTLQAHGAGGDASTATAITLLIPGYRQTSFRKMATVMSGCTDSVAANNEVWSMGLGWRSTAAINQLTVTHGGGTVLKAGSSLVVVGF